MLIRTRRMRGLAIALLSVLLLCVALALWKHHLRNRIVPLPLDLAAWQSYEGNWAVRNGEIIDRTGGRGDKLMTGDPNLNDFVYRGEVRFDSERDYEFGDAGLVLRASNLAAGTDSFYGYYVGIRPKTQTVKLGRVQDDYIDLAMRPLDEPVRIGQWYGLTVEAHACTFNVQVRGQTGRTIGTLHFDDRECALRAGQVGIRSYGMVASWKDLSIQQEP